MIGVNILAKHVSKTAGLAMFGTALLLVFLFVLFTYLAEFAELKAGYTAMDALRYVLWQSPKFLYQLMPVAALIGAVLGLGTLASNSELIIMRSAGISLWRIVGWVVRPALVMVVVAFALSQWAMPYSEQQAKQIRQQSGIKTKVGSVQGYWTRDGNRYIYIDYANSLGQLKNIHVLEMDDNRHLRQTLSAQSGHYKNEQQWMLQNIQRSVIAADGHAAMTKVDTSPINLALQPRFVQLVTISPEDLAPSELIEYMRYLSTHTQLPKTYVLAFWQKVASPFSLIALVVIACSFIFGPLRQQSVGFRLVIALFIGLGFHYVQDFLGYASLVYSPSPAWFVLVPILLSFALGAYLLHRVK
jgi:lipopolysaccharide export system permease protein